ncbi:DUF4232 domain-containing protein [Pseudarthrobacter sp. H3Y2-7]|uniref:DUF4232 domain-containing protein n=1 Tax=Pseudarthrobacter naphthalenicus TaxID=3031328 RepID=UPI0023B0C659|nr:DUF4232 domain-containing protein [Pseudarthrobacter sp. H3Y2-7]MDE8669368.1 DUF4232 domain-containing protein [Pseudarthrobacter sp. H3Y2-7]
MTSQRISQGFLITTAVAAAAMMLTACGSGQAQPQSQGTTAPGTESAKPAPTSAAPSASQAPTSLATTGPTGPSRCKAATLSAATDATGGGAAGSVYMTLTLTNTGTEPCLLKGYPGVSLTADANGAPIGAPAKRDESTPVAEVLLAPGQGGKAVLRYTHAENYTDCALTPAAGYRIYPPEDTASLFLPQPTQACGNAGIELLTIGAFQAA